jgi:RNA polymerase sigma factor (sigma-70 family)
MTSDLDLLRRFARDNAQDAFAEIVRRHLNLVHSAALRQVRSPQVAEEVAQSVFADLARVAATPSSPLRGCDASSPQTLTPWLYAVTRRTAIDAIRKESRRQLREQIAVEMNNMNATSADWTQIEPLLDDAMAALDETDRSAVLLRYFENKSLREVGEALGASEDAAQKRVSRAVERLREFFSKRNVTIGASGLAVLISANAVQSAPIGLAATVSAAAVLAGTAVHTSTVIAATKAIAMTTIQKTLVTATVAVLAGAGIYEARQASQMREQNQTLQQQQAPMAARIQLLQRELNDATNQVSGLLAENAQLKSNSNENELLKLRGEVTLLKASKTAVVGGTTDPLDSAAKDLLAKVAELKGQFDQMPDKKIPEMQFLAPQDWFEVALQPGYSNTTQVRYNLNSLRRKAKDKFAVMMADALSDYAQSNGGRLPSDLSQLKPFFASPVDDAVLSRYQLLQSGNLSQMLPQSDLVAEKSTVDEKFDSLYSIGLDHYTVRDFVGSGIRGGNSGGYTRGILPRSARPR